MGEAASGDLGLMHLGRGDFVQAMDILLKGDPVGRWRVHLPPVRFIWFAQ
jgi:hypothetical protein